MKLLPDLDDPIPDPEASPVKEDWRQCQVTAKRHLLALEQVLARSYTYQQSLSSKPRGVLWVGGGKYWPGIAVGIRLLREIGCDLPIEVWFRGDDEPVNPDDVAGLGDVRFIDSKKLSKTMGDARILRGWESKLYAITHTEFDTLLYLDADAYAVVDPTPLFDLADDHGFCFWQDMDNCDPYVKWPMVWPEGSGGQVPIQGGQLAINRQKVWDTICVAHWMNQHSDFYYAHMFGDQDSWRVAFAATGEKTHNLGRAPWRETAFVCPLPGGPEAIVHRCQGKLFRPSDVPSRFGESFASPRWSLPKEVRVFDHFSQILQPERDAESVFRAIYTNKVWGNGSGPGSLPEEAKPYVSFINSLAHVAGWRSCLDLGCGDGAVAMNLQIPIYHGIDIYREVIERNKQMMPSKGWQVLDFYSQRDLLPPADVLLCKDVLHHWPNDWVENFLSWALQSGKWKWMLFTQDVHQQKDGQDTYLGGYRALHPRMRPMSHFPAAIRHEYLHKMVHVYSA